MKTMYHILNIMSGDSWISPQNQLAMRDGLGHIYTYRNPQYTNPRGS